MIIGINCGHTKEGAGTGAEGIKIIQGKLKHNKKRFPIPGAFLQHVFGDLIPLIC